MICEKCNKEFFEDWRKDKKTIKKNPVPKFCCRSCANSREMQQETKLKISKSLIGNKAWNKNLKDSEKLKKFSTYSRKASPETVFDISSRTLSKILIRLNKPCSYCGWHVEGAVGDIHHIIPKKEGGTNDHSNLTYICPNCHRLWHSGIIKSEEFISIDKYIGDEWKQFYFATIEE